MVVSVVSGLTSASFTRDPLKIVFNVSNALVSTFVAGLVYLALVPEGQGLAARIVPAFTATAVDFFANTMALAVVVALSSGSAPVTVWRQNYQWAMPGYLAGAGRDQGSSYLVVSEYFSPRWLTPAQGKIDIAPELAAICLATPINKGTKLRIEKPEHATAEAHIIIEMLWWNVAFEEVI